MTREQAWAGGISFACLLVYAFSWSDGISLVDAGLFQMVCQDNGIAHPPGYPLATLLCHPFMSLPLPGTLPGNLFSALFAAATLVVFFFLCRTFTLEPVWSVLATFALGLALSFWSQSIIIEVYTLNTFLFGLAYLGTVRYLDGHRELWLVVAVFAFALGLSNHWPLIILSSIAFIPILLAEYTRVQAVLFRPGLLVTLLLCLLVGLSPYLLILMKPVGVVSMIGDIHSIEDLWRLVSRQTYQDGNLEGISQRQSYLWWLPLMSINQLGMLAWVLVPLGMLSAFYCLSRRYAVSLLLLWVSNVMILPLISSYPFDESMQAHYVSWTLLAIFPCAIWLALGVKFLLSRFPTIEGFAAAVVILAIAIQNFSRLGSQDTIWVDTYYRLMLSSLKRDAVLFVAGDAQTGPVAYLHHVQNIRPDIEVRHQHNILFANRLVKPDLPGPVQEKAIEKFVEHTPRPVYSISGLGQTAVDFGMYYELNEEAGFAFLPELDIYMAQLIPALEAGVVREPFIRLFLHKIVYDYARAVVGDSIVRAGLDEASRQRLLLVVATLQGKIWTLHHLLRGEGNEINLDQLRSLIEAGEAQLLNDPVDTGAGAFLRLAADAYQEHLGQSDKAANHYSWARTFDIRDETCQHLEKSLRRDLMPALGC